MTTLTYQNQHMCRRVLNNNDQVGWKNPKKIQDEKDFLGEYKMQRFIDERR